MTTGLATEGKVKEATSYKGLVDEKIWKRLVGRIQKDEGIVQEEAEQIMDAALGFLKLCADYPGNKFAPSTKVDIGWHTFLMYTKEYQEFCGKMGRKFIHHSPADDPDAKFSKEENGGTKRTFRFMKEVGIYADPEMWLLDRADGSPCWDDPNECVTGECSGVVAIHKKDQAQGGVAQLADAACGACSVDCRDDCWSCTSA